MFENDWILQQLAQQRRTDLLRQIERERLIREFQSSAQKHGHTWYHPLDWIGGQMIRWGERLQTRHALYHTQSLTHITRG
jgi:hypothetical protein